MEEYDVLIIGGSIAGSVCAKVLSKNNLNVLMVEVAETPREKACSGIQFPYFEKLIGKKIPTNKLCSNKLNKLYIEYPNKKKFDIGFKMLNFTRDIFDAWLNQLAINEGTIFRDKTRVIDFQKNTDDFKVALHPKRSSVEYVKCRYLIAAGGLMSLVHRRLRPKHFLDKPLAPTMNYYIKAPNDGDLDPNTLYQFWNLDFSNTMFAWTYKKNDLWVIGTGHTNDYIKKCNNLLNYIKKSFNLKGEIVKKEGFASTLNLLDPDHVFLGQGNLLIIGDAAGLVDMYRGLGMDAAALSGRLAAKAILNTKNTNKPAIKYYQDHMNRVVKRIEKNTERLIYYCKDNKELLEYLNKKSLKSGLYTLFGNLLNKILPTNRMLLLPY